MRTLTMTPRIATLVAVVATAMLGAAGCGGGGDPSASGPTSPSLPSGSQLNSPRPGVSIAPSNAPPAAGSGAAGSPGATGDDRGGANGSGNDGSSTGALPAPAGNTGPGSLPADFPLPSGTTLGRIAVRSTDITAPMEVPDGGQAAAFWKKELPAAGYKIRSAVVTKAIGEIKFSGNGCKSGSDIAISGEHVAFLCRR
jgi:hypothetical protein